MDALTLSECPPGWYGANCSEICADGLYGRLCKEQCPSQCNTTCDKISGRCQGKWKKTRTSCFVFITCQNM